MKKFELSYTNTSATWYVLIINNDNLPLKVKQHWKDTILKCFLINNTNKLMAIFLCHTFFVSNQDFITYMYRVATDQA